MRIQKIKNRGVLFTYNNSSEWDLNLHLIMGKKYNYIIDTGLGSLSIDPIKEYIKNSNKPIVVINTHYHWDHIWGNSSLRDCIIISHKLCREIIKSEWEDMINENKQYCYGEVEMYLPNLVFEKELYFPEDKIRIICTPGHTIDSISVIDEEDKVINVGDNIGDDMDQIIPDIYCEKSIYIDTLLKYREIDFDTCISGHNVILGKDVIEKILNNL
ncbi:MBL fold metallo-hydrolase [Clostridium sp. CF012]|uniref:MBL fold metallo-hydrolase n=1 Tax=Clostridium sp. CF012 TaxID=2843319 RepID=UPI001C0B7618|nr:MBL fold metallo-hydrolase [Clostridium sp. CF012]MBU3144506.1 MBL fold metallo-hydrolase [Clostridium sp. CF012]